MKSPPPKTRDAFEAKSFGFQKVLYMPHDPLRQLDGTMIEFEFPLGGELRLLQGRGKYVKSDPDFGNVLKILVDDQRGEFEILLPESNWQGPFEPSAIPGCDFRLSLAREAG